MKKITGVILFLCLISMGSFAHFQMIYTADSNISGKSKGGRMLGSALLSMVFPLPGAQTIKTL